MDKVIDHPFKIEKSIYKKKSGKVLWMRAAVIVWPLISGLWFSMVVQDLAPAKTLMLKLLVGEVRFDQVNIHYGIFFLTLFLSGGVFLVWHYLKQDDQLDSIRILEIAKTIDRAPDYDIIRATPYFVQKMNELLSPLKPYLSIEASEALEPHELNKIKSIYESVFRRSLQQILGVTHDYFKEGSGILRADLFIYFNTREERTIKSLVKKQKSVNVETARDNKEIFGVFFLNSETSAQSELTRDGIEQQKSDRKYNTFITASSGKGDNHLSSLLNGGYAISKDTSKLDHFVNVRDEQTGQFVTEDFFLSFDKNVKSYLSIRIMSKSDKPLGMIRINSFNEFAFDVEKKYILTYLYISLSPLAAAMREEVEAYKGLLAR